MPKIRLEDAFQDKEDYEDYQNSKDLFYFEKFCGSCDHFEKEGECPFYGEVFSETMWEHKTHIVEGVKKKCDNFMD